MSDTTESSCIYVNAIFDGGSQKTYISERLVERLQLKDSGKQDMTICAFGSKKGFSMSVKEYDFCLHGKRSERFYLKGCAVPTICAPLNNYKLEVDLLKEKNKNINWSDYLPSDEIIDGNIDILIGADYYWSLITEDVIRLQDSLVLVSSKFGYTLSGPMLSPNESESVEASSHNSNFCVHVMKVSCSESDEFSVEGLSPLDDKIERFWNLDSVGILSEEKSVFEKNMDKIQFVEGRYQVELPFKEGHPILEDNYNTCLKRLSSLMSSKLKKNKDLLEKYDDVIKKQIQHGIVELVDDNEEVEKGSVTYMPHRPVIKEDKATTKVRIVYDCSAKAGEYSLNECLYKGTCLTPLIFDSWLRFRLNPVALVADIESAYLQISIAPEQRNFLRFLWYKDVLNNDYGIQKLRFARVIFGAAPSQYLLNSVIRKHVEQYQETDPNFERRVKEGFYVDDLNTSLKTTVEAVEFYQKCKIRFAGAGFNIRKWRSNDNHLKDIFSKNEVRYEETDNAKVLGFNWNDSTDELILNLNQIFPDVKAEMTKRDILKIMASCYDPVGWIQPAVMKLKVLFQESCKLKISWDEMIPSDLKEKVIKTLAELRNLGSITIPRCYCYIDVSNPIEKVALHGFSDSSLSAYGAVVYLKFIKCNGENSVSLVASKSRVAPLKNQQTIPRLELMGNVILSRLVLSVLNGIGDGLKIDEIFCHTDSQICLCWIKAVEKEFQPFVQNRINEVRSNVSVNNWYYCKTKENPADFLTRINNQGLKSTQWWNCPLFLRNANFCLQPQEEILDNINEFEFNAELKSYNKVNTLIAANERTLVENTIDIEKFSDLFRLLRVTAYVLRFIHNAKMKVAQNENDKRVNHLIAFEVREALLLWIKVNQQYLLDDIEYSQVIANQLNCKMDSEKVIRCYGRMRNANIPESVKAPIMLSKEHYLSKLIVEYCHLKVMHRGLKQTLSEFRSTYWVTKGRSFVRKITGSCAFCKKLNGRSYRYPGHSDLPALRFDDRFPFASTGVDYLGPLHVLPVYGSGKVERLNKAYIVLYICASTRAIILDVVNSANTKNFIQSLRRFTARRGTPARMISDNGSSFVADETQMFATSL